MTNVHTNHPENKGDVAAHMCHRVATAEKHYRFIEKQRNSLKCTQIIHDTLSTPVESTSQDFFRPETKTQQLTVCQNQSDKRITWSIADRDVVRKKFHSFVVSEKTPIAQIESVLNSDTALRDRLEASLGITGKALARAVRAKVRSFFRWKSVR